MDEAVTCEVRLQPERSYTRLTPVCGKPAKGQLEDGTPVCGIHLRSMTALGSEPGGRTGEEDRGVRRDSGPA